MLFFLLVVCVVVIWYFNRKKKSSQVSCSETDKELINSLEPTESMDFSNVPFLMKQYEVLKAVVTPNKYGEYNEFEKVGKTIAKINNEVSSVLTPGSEKYISYFTSMFHQIIIYMYNSNIELLSKATKYTLEQKYLWEETGKCQTFVKGLSDDPLVVQAEIIMTACHKCWIKSIKATMWRKEMEKYDLPTSI